MVASLALSLASQLTAIAQAASSNTWNRASAENGKLKVPVRKGRDGSFGR
jgi:hypothetical protein